MKKLFLPVLSAVVISVTAIGCSDKKDPIDPTIPGTEVPNEDGEVVKKGIIEKDETWSAKNIYVLDGRVVVNEGVTLTIEAGTIIKAKSGEGADASAFIVDQGGQVIAKGTAVKPIIFTSVLDKIKVGETKSTLSVEEAGQWGGVVMLGKAPISVDNATGTAMIEGIPADLPYGQYGGKDAEDNSGVLEYVSIRFSGIELSPNNEIQGLTLGGVGRGTKIENLEIFSNLDDGVEFFGGNVDVKNVLVYGQWDDGLDIDQAYSGTIDNAFVIQTKESDSALEIDGPEGNDKAAFTIKNLTIDMSGVEGNRIADFRDGAMGHLENVSVTGLDANGLTVRLNDDKSINNFNDDKITFKNWEFVLPAGKKIEELLVVGDKATATPVAGKFTDNATAVEEVTLGANLKAFEWTFAKDQKAF